MTRILVVDDDLDFLVLMKFILKNNHYEVRLISNWQEIKTTVKSFQPHLIILDIFLGARDGRKICKELKEDRETKKIPVILYSSSKSNEIHSACNAQAFVEKPFEILELLKTIHFLTKPEFAGNLIKESLPNMKKDLSIHFSELECANTHLLSCETNVDIDNAETWIRIINLDIEIIRAENLLCFN